MENLSLNLFITDLLVDINESLNTHNAFVMLSNLRKNEKFIIIELILVGEFCGSCSSLSNTKEQVKKLIIEEVKDILQYKGRINVHFAESIPFDEKMVLKD